MALVTLRSKEMYDLETLGASSVFMETAALTAAVAMAAAEAMPELPKRSAKDVEDDEEEEGLFFGNGALSSSSSSGVGGRVWGGESNVDALWRYTAGRLVICAGVVTKAPASGLRDKAASRVSRLIFMVFCELLFGCFFLVLLLYEQVALS